MQVDTINEKSAESNLFTGLVVVLSSFVVLYPGVAFLAETFSKQKDKVTGRTYKSIDKLSSLDTFKKGKSPMMSPSALSPLKWSRKVCCERKV